MSNTGSWSIALLFLGFAIIALEFFLPSGGLLGVAATACLIGAVIVGFSAGPTWGFTVLALLAIGLPLMIALLIRIWPYTPIGRSILNRTPGEVGDVLPDDPFHKTLDQLVGRVGVALTELLPSGLIELEGRRYDAISPGVIVAPGQRVEVYSVEAGKIRVRPTNRRPETPPREIDTETRPLRDLGLEELEEPLG